MPASNVSQVQGTPLHKQPHIATNSKMFTPLPILSPLKQCKETERKKKKMTKKIKNYLNPSSIFPKLPCDVLVNHSRHSWHKKTLKHIAFKGEQTSTQKPFPEGIYIYISKYNIWRHLFTFFALFFLKKFLPRFMMAKEDDDSVQRFHVGLPPSHDTLQFLLCSNGSCCWQETGVA